jgi:hypothetical protein
VLPKGACLDCCSQQVGSAERPRVGLPWPVGAAVESVGAEGGQRWPLFRRRSGGWVPVDCGAAPEPERLWVPHSSFHSASPAARGLAAIPRQGAPASAHPVVKTPHHSSAEHLDRSSCPRNEVALLRLTGPQAVRSDSPSFLQEPLYEAAITLDRHRPALPSTRKHPRRAMRRGAAWPPAGATQQLPE